LVFFGQAGRIRGGRCEKERRGGGKGKRKKKKNGKKAPKNFKTTPKKLKNSTPPPPDLSRLTLPAIAWKKNSAGPNPS
jgi:hypothetical protein